MKEATGTRLRVLKVQEGVVVPPVLLRRLLPDVATIVKDAMTAGVSKLVQYSPCNTQDTDDRCKPQDSNNTPQPQDTESTSRSQDADDRCKPQDTNNTPQPQDTESTSRSQDADDRCKPQDSNNTPQPQDTESTSRSQDADDTCKQQNIEDTSKSQDNHILNPFPCDICKFRFSSRYTLNTHLLIHKYVCVMCKIDFGSKNLFLKHKCWFCKICNKPCTIFDHKNCAKVTQYRCEICNETFEDSLAVTSHRRTHGAPMRSYTRKPKAVNAQEERREPVNIVKGQNLSDVPTELDRDPEPQVRVNVKDGHEDRSFYKSSNEDLGRDGVTEPKRKSVKVEIKLDVDEDTRNPNQEGLNIGETLKHLDGVKVEPDFRDEPNDNFEVTYTSTLHETLRDKDIREAIDKVDVVTEESSKLFEAVKIEPELRLEIKKEPNDRLELEVMCEKLDVKAFPLGFSTSEPSARDQIVDGIASGPVLERAPNIYTGKNVMTAGSIKQVQHSACNPQDPDDTCKPQDTDNTLKPQDTDYTSKSRDAESTSKSQNTNNKWKPQTQHECRKCNIVFGSKNLFVKHKCCICKICHKPRARSYKKCHKVFTCICGEKFKRMKDFTTHQKIHRQIYGSCPACSKQFTNRTDLINHVNNMKYPCIYCDTCFPDLEQLLAHNKARKKPPKHKICKETFEDIVSATWHGAPVRSYRRKPKAVNAQEERREPVNIVKRQNLKDVPIELDGDPEPQERVNVPHGHEDRSCYKRSNEDLGRDGITEPKRKSVKVEIKLDVDDEMSNPNEKGLNTGENLKHLGDVKVEPDLIDEANENFEVITNTFPLLLRDTDMREAIGKMDVVTEESFKLFEIDNEDRREIKEEPNERLESVGFDEVMDEVQDVKTWPKLSTSELYAGHLIVDGIALGPVRVRAPIVYTGKNALRRNTSAQMLEPCPIKVEPAETPDEIEAADIKRENV